jgi:hypothetical protein
MKKEDSLPDSLFEQQREKLMRDPNLWQNDLLSPQKFWKLAKDKGIQIFNYKTICALWDAGFVRADVVISKKEVEETSLMLAYEDGGYYYYIDQRKLPQQDDGYGGCMAGFELDSDIELLFHPFRLYPLYHVARAFNSWSTSTQYLSHPPGLIEAAELQMEQFDRWTAKQEFCDRFDFWNKIAETAIVLEPASYYRVFYSLRWRFPDDEESIINKLDEYENDLNKVLAKLEVVPLEEARKELCVSAEMLDDNKVLHVLLRLTSWHKKQNLKGDVGASLLFLSMAEIIRRSVEKAHDIELPEEDELGFGQWFDGARKSLYGAERVLDAPKTEIRDFMAELGLDCGTKVRCYVEGETELGAIKHVFEGIGGIEIVNLRGQVIEKKGKGVSFKDALKNDAKSYVFSFVFLDGDVEHNIRAVKKAAEEDIICGRFFISNPDFEFENFSYEDLVEVAISVAEEANLTPPDRGEMQNKKGGIETANQFFKALYDVAPEISRYCKKSEVWGEALMKFANESDKKTPCTEAVRQVLLANRAKYSISREKYRIDPETGELIEREKAVC